MISTAATQRVAEWDYPTAERVALVGEWDLLFDAIERAGCELGVQGRLRLLGLAGRLSEAGADLKNPKVLKAHLVPIAAIETEKITAIEEVIERWVAQAATGTVQRWRHLSAEPEQTDAISTVLRIDRRSRRWLIVGAVITLGLLTIWALGLIWPLSPQPTPNSTTPAIPLPPTALGIAWQHRAEDLLIRVVFALPVLFFGCLLAGWRSAAGDRLVRRAGTADWSELFALAVERPPWFSLDGSRRLFEGLKQKLYRTTDRIDAPASVHATLRAGMSPVVQYQFVEEPSTYVILVDRRAANDHAELLVQSLRAALRSAKIRFAHYEFRGRPALCMPVTDDPTSLAVALPLNNVAKRHAGERLLLVSDGEDLFERPGWRRRRNRERYFVPPWTPIAELNTLRNFGSATLLTPTPRNAWGTSEQKLGDLGFLVATADAEGIAQIGQRIAQGGEKYTEHTPLGSPDEAFISHLSADSLRYASNIPPPPEEIADLVTDLRAWLARCVPDHSLRPGRGFLILCGIAAFPTIAPGLTLYIARLLSAVPGKEQAPIDAGILAPLARLPWLRDGRMPDWLRIALLNSLDEEGLNQVRSLQLAVLAEARPASGPIDVAGLERIAAAFEVAVGKPVDEASLRIAPGLPGEEVERIFLAVLRGERLDPVRDVITPEAPEVIRERLARPERRRRSAWFVATGVLAGAVALCEPVLASWIAGGWEAITALSSVIRQVPITKPFLLALPGPWNGVAPVLGASLCLMIWFCLAMRRVTDLERHQRNLRILFYLSFLPVGLAICAVLIEPSDARMPLLFTIAAAIFLRVAPPRRTEGTLTAVEMLPKRLRADDWIATSLGSVILTVLALGPVFLFALPAFASSSTGFTEQLAWTLVGTTTWGWGSRYLRRQLLGPIEGRPTPNEQWLDFVAPGLSLLAIAGLIPSLRQFNVLSFPSSYVSLVWPIIMAVIGTITIFLSFRMATVRNTLARFMVIWTVLTTLFPLCIYYGKTDPDNKMFYVLSFGFFMTFSAATISKNLQIRELIIRTITISLYDVIWWLFITKMLSIYSFYNQLYLVMFIFFIIGVVVIWPNLRFMLFATAANRFEIWEPSRVVREAMVERARETIKNVLTSPWWFTLGLWLVALQYALPNLRLDLSPLAVPLAIIAGWRCGRAAVIPVFVGSLPFAVIINFGDFVRVTPGGVWPLVVLPLLVRVVADEGLRRRIFARTRVPLWDCAVFIVCLATGTHRALLNSEIVLSSDISWLAIAIGFLVGASRVRWQEPMLTLIVGAGVIVGLRLDASYLGTFLALAAYFGGRAWRDLVRPDIPNQPRRVLLGTMAMMCVSTVATVIGRLCTPVSWGNVPFIGNVDAATASLLLTLVGGLFLRHWVALTLTIWSVVLGLEFAGPVFGNWLAQVSGPPTLRCVAGLALSDRNLIGHWSHLACFAVFAGFGFILVVRGQGAYARALGFVPLEEPSSLERRGLDERVVA